MLEKLEKINIGYWLTLLFLSTVPFLFLGYGVEEDSWGTALAAYNTNTTGVFEVSRFPGHPVQEIIYSVLWFDSPFVFNLLTSFFGLISFYYFYKILCFYKFQNPIIGAIAFFYVPVVFISSTYTIDYMWAVAFCLASWYSLLQNKIFISGVLLGLAIGCRISSGAMLLPFLFILVDNYKKIDLIKKAAVLGFSTGVIAVICFIPVIKVYGFNFLVFWDLFAPSLAKLIYKSTIGVFGVIGCLALLLAFAFSIKNKFKTQHAFNKWHTLSWVSMILIFAYSYIRLPQKSAYLINCIPPLLFFIYLFLNKKQMLIFCCSLIISSLCCGINLTNKVRGSKHSALAITKTISGQEIYFDVLTGPALADYYKREQKEIFADYTFKTLQQCTTKTAVISGWWYNHLLVKAIKKPFSDKIKLLNYESEIVLHQLQEEKYQIYYLPEMDSINDVYLQQTFTKRYAKPFPILY